MAMQQLYKEENSFTSIKNVNFLTATNFTIGKISWLEFFPKLNSRGVGIRMSWVENFR